MLLVGHLPSASGGVVRAVYEQASHIRVPFVGDEVTM